MQKTPWTPSVSLKNSADSHPKAAPSARPFSFSLVVPFVLFVAFVLFLMTSPQYNPERSRLLALTEQQLLAECRCDTMRGTGPGGQKRNKTESAVRVTHVATGLFAVDDVERSQHINRHHALQKLRLEFALHLRCEPTSWKQPVPSPSSDNYPLWAAVALDALFATDFKLAEAVAILETTTSQLVKHLQKLPALWQFVNAERVKRGLSPLKNL